RAVGGPHQRAAALAAPGRGVVGARLLRRVGLAGDLGAVAERDRVGRPARGRRLRAVGLAERVARRVKKWGQAPFPAAPQGSIGNDPTAKSSLSPFFRTEEPSVIIRSKPPEGPRYVELDVRSNF